MFHTILVKIRKIAAISMLIELPLKRVMKNVIAAGKKPSMGTDCKISIIGMITLDAVLFLAAVIPTISATRNEITNATNILKTEEIESIINAEGFICKLGVDLFARNSIIVEMEIQATIKINILLFILVYSLS